jgi:NAD(P)-dependent dehydrogenase (short-subunit alcohol dehydrogenase family)
VAADLFSLSGKSILITGASSGIGRQAAITCAERGATLIISGRDEARLNDTLKRLPGSGHRAVTADLTDAAQMVRLADEAGAVHGFFHSAGVAAIAPFRMVSQKHLDTLLKANFEAPVLLTQRLLSKRQVQAGGSIVFNTAGAADNSPNASAIYSAAKAALRAASRTLALEVARNRIRVTCLQLGYIHTEMLERLSEQGMAPDDLSSHIPLGEGTPVDAANAVVFLLSDASRWISRTSLIVDGGLSLRISR